MKTKKVNRYYCDFCKKANCCKSAMILHEKHCTANPARECRMCKTPRDISFLIGLLLDAKTTDDDGMTVLRVACNCPACILAVLRQSKLAGIVTFDYKEEAKAWWDAKILKDHEEANY